MKCLLSDHRGIGLEINNRKVTEKFPSMWIVNNILLNDIWVKEEILKYFPLRC